MEPVIIARQVHKLQNGDIFLLSKEALFNFLETMPDTFLPEICKCSCGCGNYLVFHKENKIKKEYFHY